MSSLRHEIFSMVRLKYIVGCSKKIAANLIYNIYAYHSESGQLFLQITAKSNIKGKKNYNFKTTSKKQVIIILTSAMDCTWTYL